MPVLPRVRGQVVVVEGEGEGVEGVDLGTGKGGEEWGGRREQMLWLLI